MMISNDSNVVYNHTNYLNGLLVYVIAVLAAVVPWFTHQDVAAATSDIEARYSQELEFLRTFLCKSPLRRLGILVVLVSY